MTFGGADSTARVWTYGMRRAAASSSPKAPSLAPASAPAPAPAPPAPSSAPALFPPDAACASSLLAFGTVLAGALLLLLFHAAGLDAAEGMLPPPAASKPYADFATFYRERYVPEHSLAGTRALHAVGTGLAVALVARTPRLGLALAFAGVCGLSLVPYLRFMSSGMLEFGAMIAAYLASGAALTGSLRRTAALPLAAYAFAWAGHFFVEHNVPATFIYPTYSLFGDFRMVAEIGLSFLGGAGVGGGGDATTQ